MKEILLRNIDIITILKNNYYILSNDVCFYFINAFL